MKTPLFNFGDIVVTKESWRKNTWVIVKTWETKKWYEYEVYVRVFGKIFECAQDDLKRLIIHKELCEEDIEYYEADTSNMFE